MNHILQLCQVPARRLFLSSLSVAALAVFLLQVEISQVRVLGYMQYAIAATFLFGLYKGLNRDVRQTETLRTESAVWRWRRQPSLANIALLLWLLVAIRLAGLGDLGLIPDGTTSFHALRFLQPDFFHEAVITAILVALFQLNVSIIQSLTVQLFRPAGDAIESTGIAILGGITGLLAGCLVVSAILFCLPGMRPQPTNSANVLSNVSQLIVAHPENVLLLNAGNTAKSPGLTANPRSFRNLLSPGTKYYDLVMLDDPVSNASVSPFTPVRAEDCFTTEEAFQLIRRNLNSNGYLIVRTTNPRNWHFLRLARDAQSTFAIIDGFAKTSDGAQLFAVSPAHGRDLQPILAASPDVVAAPETISINEKARNTLPGSDDWPFSFLEFRTIPLPYLWCLYVLGGLLLFNAGTVEQIKPSRRSVRWFVLGLSAGTVLVWSAMRLSVLTGDDPASGAATIAGMLALTGLGAAAVARKIAAPRLVTWVLVFLDVVACIWFTRESTIVVPLLAALLVFTLAVAVMSELNCESDGGYGPVAIAGISVALLFENLTFITGISSLLYIAAPLLAVGWGMSYLRDADAPQVQAAQVQ